MNSISGNALYNKLNFNSKSIYQNVKKTVIGTTAMSLIPITTLYFMSIGEVLAKTGLCVHHYMTENIETNIGDFVLFNDSMRYRMFSSSGNLRLGVGGPIVEEVTFRLGLQEILLKQLPKKILSKTFPKYTHLVDHPIAKVSRIVFTSALFGLIHYWPWAEDPTKACATSNGSVGAPFLAGMILGFIQEQTGNPLYSTIAHIFHNTFWGVIISGAGKYS